MPELPEVETVRRGLQERILGLSIRKVEIFCEKSFIGEVADVMGRKVVALRRFGKALIIDLSGGVSMMIHLRMTGQLVFDGEESIGEKENDGAGIEDIEFEGRKRYAAGHPSENFVAKLPNKQTRVVFYFDEGVLYFNDQRKFGFVKVLATDEVEKEPFVAKLGKEPWEMGEEEFYEVLQRHKGAPIKAVILDQSVIAGLGNIYADESLFLSRIHPERKAGTLSRGEAAKLLRSAREVMQKSIESGGSTMATYVRADGSRGNYLEKFAQVFRKEGQPCPVCGTEIQKIRVAGRGTHICPTCQKIDGAERTASKKQKNDEVKKMKGDKEA